MDFEKSDVDLQFLDLKNQNFHSQSISDFKGFVQLPVVVENGRFKVNSSKIVNPVTFWPRSVSIFQWGKELNLSKNQSKISPSSVELF